MNTRLEFISSLIPTGTGFADIGTDHGYLPTYMAQNGYDGNIIAADIKNAPLSTAICTAREYGVEDNISFRLCDGLDAIQPNEIDTIVIAGMGGDTICGILDRAEWCLDSKFALILQPMTKVEVLRYWLTNNGFGISGEHIVRDNGELYQIICARFGEVTPLSDAELFTGLFETAAGNRDFPELLDGLSKRFQKAVDGMDKAKAPIGRKKLTADILAQLLAMKERL